MTRPPKTPMTPAALERRRTKITAEIAALIGVLVGLVGVALWVRNSLTRYLRYWLIRLIYEDREQTERLIAAIEKLAEK